MSDVVDDIILMISVISRTLKSLSAPSRTRCRSRNRFVISVMARGTRLSDTAFTMI